MLRLPREATLATVRRAGSAVFFVRMDAMSPAAPSNDEQPGSGFLGREAPLL